MLRCCGPIVDDVISAVQEACATDDEDGSADDEDEGEFAVSEADGASVPIDERLLFMNLLFFDLPLPLRSCGTSAPYAL